jgi:hypothetical protein
MHYKRIITWNMDSKFQNLTNLRVQDVDTSYNRNFYDYPFMREDINATWLGVAGSPVQFYDYFKRTEEDNAIFYTPYQSWSFSPETLPQFNTKTPYTELCYYGTLFANREKEEMNVRMLTTQNITPKLNMLIYVHNFKGNGMLKREDTANKTFSAATNYLGERYLMHAGFIYNKIERSENGGLIDPMWIRDTLVDAREIDVYLRDASNTLKKSTLFLDQSYRIPFTFLDKDERAARKEEKLKIARRDSIMASGDSTAIAALLMEEEAANQLAKTTEVAADTLITDVTTAFI